MKVSRGKSLDRFYILPRVFHPPNLEWVSAEPRTAEASEVEFMCKAALRRFE